MKRFLPALAFVALLALGPAASAKGDANLCPLRLPPTNAGAEWRTLESVSAYINDDPDEIQKPEGYALPRNRFRVVWLVGHNDGFFIECGYAGGETRRVHVPSSASTCETREHLGRYESITCR